MFCHFPKFSTTLGMFVTAASIGLLNAEPTSAKPSIKFSCAVWDPLPNPEIFYRDGKSYLPIQFMPGRRSELYPIKESSGLELYEKAVGPNDSLTYKLIGKAPLVAGARQALYLVDPTPTAAGLPLTILGINDTLDIFPPGTFRFFNFCPAELRVKFGGQVSKLVAREDTVVKSNVSKKGGFLPFIIEDAASNIIFQTRLYGQPYGREMVFISPPANGAKLPRVKFLTEMVPPAPPSPPGKPSSATQ